MEEQKKIKAYQEREMMFEKEDKKSARAFMRSGHLTLYKQRSGAMKWTQGTGDVSAYYWSDKYINSNKKRPYGIVDPDMKDLLEYVEPWEEVC